MKVLHKKINFQDERGTITDIFINDPKEHGTIIFSKKGAVRGNHYHKKSTQYTFIISGKLIMLSQKIGVKKIYRHILRPNDLMIHSPKEAHTLIADEDTIFLALAEGVRGGKNYEKDTFRLSDPLTDESCKLLGK